MTDNEYSVILDRLHKEIEEFRNQMQKEPRKEIYDRYYKIHAFEALYHNLFHQAKDLKFKGFPESDIIDHYYDEFISSGYYVDSDDDLRKFCKEENKKRAEMAIRQEEIKKRKEYEM